MSNTQQGKGTSVVTKWWSAVLVAVFSVALVIACGSDNTTSNNMGLLSDPGLIEAQGVFNNFLDSAYVAVTSGYGMYYNLPSTGGSVGGAYGPINPGEGDVANHVYTEAGWHQILVIVNNGLVIWQVNDSIQFRADGVPQQAGVGADVVDYRHGWSVTPVNQSGDFSTIDGVASVVMEALDTDQSKVNGSYSFNRLDHSVDGVSGDITDNNFAVNASLVNLTVNKPGATWGNGCPISGHMSFTMNQSKTVTVADVPTTTETAWTGSVKFSEGQASVVISNGTTSWAYKCEVCSF